MGYLYYESYLYTQKLLGVSGEKNGSSFYGICSMTSQVTVIIKLGQEEQMVLLLDRTDKAL
jgi:hypothetical protein